MGVSSNTSSGKEAIPNTIATAITAMAIPAALPFFIDAFPPLFYKINKIEPHLLMKGLTFGALIHNEIWILNYFSSFPHLTPM